MNLERELEYWPPGAPTPLPIRVRIGWPEPDSHHGWASVVTFEGFPKKPLATTSAYGVDPLQALGFALTMIPLLLQRWVDRGGRVTWQGEEHLQLPSAIRDLWGDWVFTPTDGTEPRKLTIYIGQPDWIDERWSVLLRCVENKEWKSVERRITSDAWAEAVECAAAAAPALLREVVEQLGGGRLEKVHPSAECPVCGVDHEKRDPTSQPR